MRFRPAIKWQLLALGCASLFPTNAHTQSSPTPGSSCAPTVSRDDFKEMTGKKVFPKVIIDDVTFDGPVSIPPATLEALTKELTSHEFDGDPKWLEEIEGVAVRGAWQDNGYFKVAVSGRAIPRGGDSNLQHFSVVIHVDEGSQYMIGEITFRSSSPDEPLIFPTEVLRNLLPFRQGDLSSASKIRQGLDALRKLYGSHGYIDFTPTPLTDVDEVDRVVFIHFVLDQQKQFRIREITVCGSNPKFENLMKSVIKSGGVFNSTDIQSFFDKHQPELGPHFGSENVGYRRDVRNGTVDITVSLRNCPVSQD